MFVVYAVFPGIDTECLVKSSYNIDDKGVLVIGRDDFESLDELVGLIDQALDSDTIEIVVVPALPDILDELIEADYYFEVIYPFQHHDKERYVKALEDRGVCKDVMDDVYDNWGMYHDACERAGADDEHDIMRYDGLKDLIDHTL